MAERLPWQVIGDCAHCHTAGAVLEVMDPAHPAWASGRAASSTCRMCGREEAADPDPPHGVRVSPGVDPRDPVQARAALEAWAASESLSVEELCQQLGGTVDEVLDRYANGLPVDSGADVVAFLFPSVAAGSASASVVDDASTPAPAPEVRAPAPPDPRAVVRVLASVMVADGELRVGERAFVDRWLASAGLPALEPEDLRPWRPHELGPVGDRALAQRGLEAAVELMHLDGERDGSELRIVRTFARAWGVPESKVDAWNEVYDRRHAPRMSVLWRALSRWVRTR